MCCRKVSTGATRIGMHMNLNSQCKVTVEDCLGKKLEFENSKNILQAVKYNPIKLPVWPVWAGVIAFFADVLKAPKLGEFIIAHIGGRVVPISMTSDQLNLPTATDISPFLLLAHHTHSFTPLDPIRAITKWLLPEGFPAHPHAGFDTVTYCISGGLKHRDSEGFKMSYGDGEVQWMRAGKGMIHEEMWDLDGSEWKHKSIELFQLWVNLPAKEKDQPPFVKLLKPDMMPLIQVSKDIHIRVIAGDVSLQDTNQELLHESGSGLAGSPVSILHVSARLPHSSLCFTTNEENKSIFVYIRRGSLLINNFNNTTEKEEVLAFNSVVFLPSSKSLKEEKERSFVLQAGENGFDGLVLIGRPLNERVFWRGPFVQSDEEGLYRSARRFETAGGNSAFWEHTLSDEDWRNHCQRLQLQNQMDNMEEP